MAARRALERAVSARWVAALWMAVVAPAFATAFGAEQVTSITQHGVTWTFDRPVNSGRFVTGDYWIVGPVTVIGVSPRPGPADEAQATRAAPNQYGDDGLRDDRSYRNGSMIVGKISGTQGYDSRIKNFDAGMSQAFPCALQPGQSLISTVSNEDVSVASFSADILWTSEKKARLALKSAAVLTCLAEEPPADAFRPAYAGVQGKLHRASEVKWALLPKLAAPTNAPEFALYERYLQRPWLDHVPSWLTQVTGPSGNQPSYGREFSRIVSTASLLTLLDVPQEKKERLTLELVQLGIDLHGLMAMGRRWNADGGHWSGRKWPILYAGMLLGDEQMQHVPATAVFSEDVQTYYGTGFFGQTALWQMGSHHGPVQPYEERSPATWTAIDKRSESYRLNTTARAWAGSALAAQLMGAKAAWGHDAYFDYVDRFMALEDAYAARRGEFSRPKQEGSTFDPFVDAMWKAYRSQAPEQAGGVDNRKWVWIDGKRGEFVENAKP